jgi:hypothetical protein
VGLDLQDWAAWATIVGTVIVVVGTLLGWAGKLRLRLPAELSSVESRALFVICSTLVAVPIIAWGPLAGFLPALGNLLVMPSMPAYIEEYLKQPPNPRSITGARPTTLRQGIVFGLSIVLTIVNFFAVIDAVGA